MEMIGKKVFKNYYFYQLLTVMRLKFLGFRPVASAMSSTGSMWV